MSINPYDPPGRYLAMEDMNRRIAEARLQGMAQGMEQERSRQGIAQEAAIKKIFAEYASKEQPRSDAVLQLLSAIDRTLVRIEKALTMTGHKTRIKTGSTKTDANGKTRFVKADTAPPHVRAGRRRKVNKVTGARAAK